MEGFHDVGFLRPGSTFELWAHLMIDLSPSLDKRWRAQTLTKFQSLSTESSMHKFWGTTTAVISPNTGWRHAGPTRECMS